MSTPVTYVNNQYNVPAYQDTGYAQGTGNLSSYLIALATGSLTLSGGTFTLTADADFGSGFGLKSIYYKSRATNVSSTGVVRLGNAEIIGWRNAGNSNDVTLTVNASNNIIFNSNMNAMGIGTATPGSYKVRIDGSSTLGLSIYSTVAASAAYFNLENDGANIWTIANNGTGTSNPNTIEIQYNGTAVNRWATNGAHTITATSNQIVLGTTRTVTITAPTPAVSSRTITIADLSGDYSLVGTIGAQTIAGSKTFSSAIAITATSNHLVLSTSSNTLTINANTQATTGRTWSIPDISADATFAALQGTQTFTGAKTFSSAISITATSNHLVLSTATNTLTINANTQATARVWSVPDISGNGTFAALEGTQTFSGAKTFSATLTMSGATIAMGSNKITGLAAASTNGDAIRYEQLFGGAITLNGSITFNPTTAGIVGTTTNDNAASGGVGETVESTVASGSAVTLTNGQYSDVTSITLTAGDWDISCGVNFTGGAITGTQYEGGIGTVTGNSGTGLAAGNTSSQTPTSPTAASDSTVVVSSVRKSISGSTTYYLKAFAAFTGGTAKAHGRITARRRR